MQSEFLQKLIGLVAKTGNTMIVPDPTTGKSYVVMDMESYERLLVGTTPTQQAPQPFLPQQIPLGYQVPFHAPQMVMQTPAPTPFVPHQESHFIAQHSKKEIPAPTPRKAASVDLTQEELLDKINRDIGDWKIAQERQRTEVLQSAAERPDHRPAKPLLVQSLPEQTLEEEERFYLEPIE